MDNKYIRDSRSQAIQEVNYQALADHRQRRAIVKKKEIKIQTLESEMSGLREELETLKKLVSKIAKTSKGKVSNE